MPILAAEPCILPLNLLDEFCELDQERRWLAVYTRPRQEKSLARQLRAMNIPHYLPLISKSQLMGGRRVVSQVPLFTSYIFLFCHDEERIDALDTKRILQAKPASRKSEMTQDLRNIDRLIKSQLPLNVESRLLPGRRVRVKNGSLIGMEGLIIARRGGERLFVALHFLGQAVSVQIPDFQVEAV
jgi:transcription antitermination factor NusG